MTTPGRSNPAGHSKTRVATDAGGLLIVFLALLLVIPARLVLPGMGGAGRPAVALGLAMLGWWLVSHFSISLAPRGRQPLRLVLGCYVTTILAAYGLGLDRGLLPLEGRSADRYLIVFFSWIGISLIAADGLRSMASLRRVLSWLVGLSTFAAIIGIWQFRGIDLAGKIRVPGLVYNQELVGLQLRGGPGFNRVYGTMQHYIEFGVVLGMVLPLAVHLALTEPSPRTRSCRWVCVGLTATAIPFSISRAAAIGLIAGLVVLASAWNRRLKIQGLIVGLLGLVAFRVLVPGVLGTIKSLFSDLENDPSIAGRTGDYAAVGDYITDRPLLGRGPGTFVPEIYRILDNQFLGSIIEVGALGTAALALVFGLSYCQARRVRKEAVSAEAAHLGQAFAATVTVALLTSFTFDSFAFPTFAGVFFLILGLIAALARLVQEGRETVLASPADRLLGPAVELPQSLWGSAIPVACTQLPSRAATAAMERAAVPASAHTP